MKKESQSINLSPWPYIVTGLIVIAVFFGGFGVWAAVGKMEGAIIAPGIIKVEKNRKDIQHLEGGIIQKIWVRDGDKVAKGQKLLTLQSASVNANVRVLKGQLSSVLATRARLEAERDLQPTITWPEKLLSAANDPEVKKLMRAENSIFQSQKNTLKGQIKLFNTQIQQIKKQVIGLIEQVEAEDQIVNALEEELIAKRELLEDRFLEKPQVLALERELSTHKGKKSLLKGEIAQNQERITEIRIRLSELTTQYVEKAVNKLAEVQSRLFDLEDRIEPLLDAKRRLDVLAPTAGVVVDMRFFSEGGVVKPGEVLMQIVPEKEPLIIECSVRPVDIAKVYKDQPARIELNAFNRREVLPVDGKVVYVSADSVLERTPYGEQPIYQVHTEIDRDQVKAQGVELSPGMPVTVFLNTGERTFLDYIMEPLVENFRRALRE